MSEELRKTIMDAMRSVSERADEFKAGCATFDGEWPDAEDKAIYDAEVALVERLRVALAALSDVVQAPVEMSPEFTDSARAALVWVLYHHQGGSSPVGQPIRFALGMGAHEPLTPSQIGEALKLAEASRWPYARELPRAAPAIPQAAGDAGQAPLTNVQRSAIQWAIGPALSFEMDEFVAALRGLLAAPVAPAAAAPLTREAFDE